MNIIHLKYFLAVAVSGSFSEAAEMMFSTQSSVSKNISALEKELNTKLFDRSRRKISLTPQGVLAMKYSKIIIDDYNHMTMDILNLQEYDHGTVRIASTPVMMPYNILTLLSNFRRSCPEIKINVEELEGADIFPELCNGHFEMAFVRGFDIDENIYDSITLYIDRVSVVLSKNHPLADRKEISLSEISKENFMLLNKGSSLYLDCLDACNRSGFIPYISYTGNRMTNVFEMVSRDMGIGLMLHRAGLTTAKELSLLDMVFVPLKESITSNVAVIRLKRRVMNNGTAKIWEYIGKNIIDK